MPEKRGQKDVEKVIEVLKLLNNNDNNNNYYYY